MTQRAADDGREYTGLIGLYAHLVQLSCTEHLNLKINPTSITRTRL